MKNSKSHTKIVIMLYVLLFPFFAISQSDMPEEYKLSVAQAYEAGEYYLDRMKELKSSGKKTQIEREEYRFHKSDSMITFPEDKVSYEGDTVVVVREYAYDLGMYEDAIIYLADEIWDDESEVVFGGGENIAESYLLYAKLEYIIEDYEECLFSIYDMLKTQPVYLKNEKLLELTINILNEIKSKDPNLEITNNDIEENTNFSLYVDGQLVEPNSRLKPGEILSAQNLLNRLQH